MAFSLYDHPELPDYPLQLDPALPRVFDVAELLVGPWLDRFEGFDYGAMTVWLMRGFGLPNLRVYDSNKHSFSWGLDTGQGYVVTVEPGLVKVDMEEWRQAGEERDGNGWSRRDMRMTMLAHGVLDVACVDPNAPALSAKLIEGWLDEFSRPIYIRDVGASVLGPLSLEERLGPGDPRRLDGGATEAHTTGVRKRAPSPR